MDLKINKMNMAAILFIASLAYFLFFSRFDILFQDEGYFNIACARILAGQLPYRDFFLHTPPVSYFIQTLIFKIFGNALIVGRISTAILGSLITLLIFLISSRISSVLFSIVPAVLFIFWGVSHIPYPSFNWFGLFLGLVIALSFVKFIESGFKPYIIFAGFFSSFLLFTKQNLGAAAFAAIGVFFILEKILKPKEARAPDMVYFAIGAIAGSFPVLSHSYTTGILSSMLYYVFNCGYKSGMMRADIFPFPHIISVTLLVAGVYIALGIMLYQAYIKKKKAFGILLAVIIAGTILACYIFRSSADWHYILDHIKKGVFNGFFNLPVLSILAVFIIYRRRIAENRAIIFLAIFALLYIWSGILIARDFVHLIPTMPVAYVLYGALMEKMRGSLSKRIDAGFTSIYCVALPVFLLCVSGLIANLKNETFRFSSHPLVTMNARIDLPKARYLLVNPADSRTVTEAVRAIRENTNVRDKIFCMYACETFYILSDRQPASFYTFFIPNAFRETDQARVISDLETGNVRLVLGRKDLMAAKEKYAQNKNFNGTHGGGIAAQIERYIWDKYDIKKTIGDYNIFVRKR